MKRWFYVVKEDDSVTIALTTRKLARQTAKHNLFYFPISVKVAAKALAITLSQYEKKNS